MKPLNNRGETLVETLIALAISVLVLAMLSNSIVSAEKLSSKIAKEDNSFTYGKDAAADGTLTMTYGTTVTKSKDITIYTDNGFVWFEPKE